MPNTNSRERLLTIDPMGEPVVFSPGPYHREQKPFVIEVDAKPLAVLVDEAFLGSRVYELMTIVRPGDIYNYLRVCLVDVDERVTSYFQGVERKWYGSQSAWDEGCLPLPRFDALFRWDGDDTQPEDQCWLRFRENNHWQTTAIQLLAWVRTKQEQLRSTGDWLTQREIGRIDARSHCRDFVAEIERRCTVELPRENDYRLQVSVMSLIEDLITRENVQSVSVNVRDHRMWRRLVQEQLVRSDRTGYPPAEAFTLSGASGGAVPYEDWGGDIHVTYDGWRMADLIVGWPRTWPEQDKEGGSLTDVVCYTGESLKRGDICHYVLLHKDIGPLKSATRTVVGDGWFLYKSKRPYVPNPWRKPHLGGDD